MRNFEPNAPDTGTENLIDDHIRKLIASIIEKDSVLYNREVIESSIQNLKWLLHISDLETRAT